MALISPSLPLRGAAPNPTTYWAIGEAHWYKADKRLEIIVYGFISRQHRLTGLYNKMDSKGFWFDTGETDKVDMSIMYSLIKQKDEFLDSWDDPEVDSSDNLITNTETPQI